ncbi:MAG TPA: patatin family protein [Fibrobacteraceae bacterium]|nr:patatin family protein [Fibrobacteraceae bacterium]
MTDSCLVLEGGGLRCTFTGGILEALLANQIIFPRLVGVSGGACSAVSYVSRQPGRNWKIHVELPSHPEFMGFRHLLAKGSYFNPGFTFEEIPSKLVPFDENAYYSSSSKLEIVTTARATGTHAVFGTNEQARLGINKVLLASSSIPLLAPAVQLDDGFFFDGGVSDSIPVNYALEKSVKAVVVLTRPRGYRKKSPWSSYFYAWALRKYPNFLRAVVRRNEMYNTELDDCDRLEKEGRIFVFAPSAQIKVSRTEKSLKHRAAAYQHGQEIVTRELSRLQEFLGV